jgi:hypothetical protein
MKKSDLPAGMYYHHYNGSEQRVQEGYFAGNV